MQRSREHTQCGLVYRQTDGLVVMETIFWGGFVPFSSEIAAQNLINSNVSVLLGSPLMNEIGNYEKHQV